MIKRNFTTAALIAAGMFATVGAANATVVDLGTNGSGTINGALFEVSSQHPAGTGVFNPFLTVQASPTEQGYNASAGDFDTKRNGVWNHEIKFSDLQQTTINGVAYYGFMVDVNEPNGGNKANISLDGLQLYTSATIQNNVSTDANGNFNGSLGTLRYDLGANNVLYNDQHSGSGTADISIYIPVADFAGSKADDFVYMYQRWGNVQTSDGGFEETALIQGVTPVPEMSALFPIVGLMVAVGSTHILRRRKLARAAV